MSPGKRPRRAEPARHALWLGHTGQRQRHGARCLDRPQVIVDLDASYRLTSGIKLAVGANNLFNIYPNRLPVSLQGSGFSQYNTYSPYGVSGGFYYAKVAFTF
jgi:outer membrane receptor protein involved in Fe transport